MGSTRFRPRRSAMWCRGGGAIAAVVLLFVPILAINVSGDTSATSAAERARQEVIIIDGERRGRVFDGLGGVSAGGSSRLLYDYPEPERRQILDYLFEPGYGASLQILKVEIGGDMNATVGSEASHMREPDQVHCDRGHAWWLMTEARKRNPDIKLAGLQWGAPGWFDGGFWSQDNIKYLLNWLDCAEEKGLSIDYMGGWNESGFRPDWFVEFAQALEERYPDIRIVAADTTHTSGWRVATSMREDPAFDAAVDIVGVHGPGGSRTNPEYEEVESSEDALALDKPLWASEFSSLAHDVGARPLARVFNRSYIDAKITGQMIWAPVSAWYASLPIADTGPIVAEWPWSGYYDLGKSVWSLAHTTQFTDPGWHYLDTGSRRLESGATVVSLASSDGEDYSIIVEGMDLDTSTTATFKLRNLPERELHVWATDLTSDDTEDHFQHIEAIIPENGTFQLTLEPDHLYSISTRTDAGRGDARPHATAHEQMDLPFTATFDDLEPGQLARFFSDVNGAFEASPSGGGREGMSYRQVVSRQPIEWHGPDMPPTTLAGDPRWWGDYRVSSDVLLEHEGYVELLGRVDGVQGDEFVSGYYLRLSDDGLWRLYSMDMTGSEVELASGEVPVETGRWHNLAMDFNGTRIQVMIDDTAVADVESDHHRVGQIGLRTGRWNLAQFDDVRVTPTGPWPDFVPQESMTATASSAHEGNAYGYTYPALAAIDGRPETYWRSEWDPPAPLPQAITIDLGSSRTVRALTYRPRISGHWAAKYPGGPITRYAVHVSTDGQTFEQVASGTWRDSMAATKVVTFQEDREARFVRLEALEGGSEDDQSVTAAEIKISATPIPE